jgi:hypothetical protein
MISEFQKFLNSAREIITKQCCKDSKYDGFMTLRILSMDKSIISNLSDVQPFLRFLNNDQQQKLLTKILPKKNFFNIRYVSGNKTKKKG